MIIMQPVVAMVLIMQVVVTMISNLNLKIYKKER